MTLIRRFPWNRESELLVWCARTEVPEDLTKAIRMRAGEPLNWGNVLSQAAAHGVGPLVYRNLAAFCSDLVPAPVLTALRQKVQAGTLLNQVLARELVSLCDAFAARGVPVLPIKGATLAVTAYRDLSLRDFGDVDLLIPERALNEARAVLAAQGYEVKDPATDAEAVNHDEGPYHVYIKKHSLSRVDLQWVMAHDCFQFLLDRPEFWSRSRPVLFGEKAVRSLSPEDLLIVLCVHGSKHAWEQLKWVCDVAELLRSHRSMEWDLIWSSAEAWRCRRLVAMGLALAHLVLDAPLPPIMVSRIAADPDVQDAAHRMPGALLKDRQAGVREDQAVALYFSLKDSWLERWLFGLMLCREGHPLLKSLPSWFRWRRALPQLAQAAGPLQCAVRSLMPTALRDAVNRRLDRGGVAAAH